MFHTLGTRWKGRNILPFGEKGSPTEASVFWRSFKSLEPTPRNINLLVLEWIDHFQTPKITPMLSFLILVVLFSGASNAFPWLLARDNAECSSELCSLPVGTSLCCEPTVRYVCAQSGAWRKGPCPDGQICTGAGYDPNDATCVATG